MPNLMIVNDGGLGDTAYSVPMLNVLRGMFDEIYMSGRPQCQKALQNTGLVDRFIIKPPEYHREWYEGGMSDDEKRAFLSEQSRDLHVAAWLKTQASRYMYHPYQDAFYAPKWWKVDRARGKSFFDVVAANARITSRTAKGYTACIKDGVPEAYGKRPITKLTHTERSWLRDFRYAYRVPRHAFLLGWQFVGSSVLKWYPYFEEVIQRRIMQAHPEVYVVGFGDLERHFNWGSAFHHGRFINLMDTVTFRQAYLATSLLDCLVSPETGVFVFAQAFPNVPKILLATHSTGEHICCGRENVILQADCDCAPCYNILSDCVRDPKTNAVKCMASIKPERVIEAIETVIRQR